MKTLMIVIGTVWTVVNLHALFLINDGPAHVDAISGKTKAAIQTVQSALPQVYFPEDGAELAPEASEESK